MQQILLNKELIMKYLAVLMLLVSCGRPSMDAIYIQNPYDDSKLQAYELIQDARIKALEDRLEDLDTINDTLTDIQQQVTANKVNVVKICASNEYMIKMNNEFYAVYMVSNNFGTYLGKLDNGVQYQTTDSVRSRFSVNNGVLTCL
jgi:hypothetical protein